MAGGRDRLGDLAQPGVGNAAARLDQRHHRQCRVHRLDRGAAPLHRRHRRRLPPRARRSADLRDRRRGRHVSADRGGSRLLVRVRLHALRPASLPPSRTRELFEAGFPAEFIAEGLDQTRGWFYTLCVLGRRPLRQAGVSQRHRQRHGHGRRRQEDVEASAQLHATGRTDGELRRPMPCASISSTPA